MIDYSDLTITFNWLLMTMRYDDSKLKLAINMIIVVVIIIIGTCHD